MNPTDAPASRGRRAFSMSARTVAAAIAGGVLAAGSFGAGSVSAQSPTVEFVDNGRGPVAVYLPSDYDPAEPLPLVVLLHGYQQDAGDIESFLNITAQVEPKGFICVIPEGTISILLRLRFWNATDACCNFKGSGVNDSAYLRSLVELAQNQYAVDDRRVHFLGYSNGGFMSYRMACDHADLIASVASLAGATWDDPALCNPSEPVSTLQVHGTSDGVIAYNGGCLLGGCHPGGPGSAGIWATYNGCAPLPTPLGGPFDLDLGVPGFEASAELYDGCEDGVETELWTMAGSPHGPTFLVPGEAAVENRFAQLAVDWLLAHPKPGPCAADINGDGVATASDFTAWLEVFNNQGTATPEALERADVNNDGSITAADFTAWLEAFGIGC